MTATHRDGGRRFWVATAIGWVIIGYGLWGLLGERERTAPASLGRWFIGGVVVHDLVWIPLVLVVSALLARLRPGRWRPAVAWALATSAVLVVTAWPLVQGYGRDPRNPSLLPRNYLAGLLAYLAVTWAAAAGWAVLMARRGDRRR